ncbi:hypothetical protein MTO96_019979 [Rhipicephalus appendiculatus]
MTEKTLRSISTLFLACVPVAELRKLLDAVPSELLTQEFQETLIGRTILHPTAAAYPPRPVYIRNFLKCLINKLEEKNVEIADNLYVHFAEKLGGVNSDEDIPGFVTYTIVTLKEHTAFVIGGTTGLTTWQASKFLSEWCLENRHLLRGKRILELGCGIGLTGIVENLKWNGVTECHARVETLHWGEHESFEERCTADIILGADLVYDPEVVPALVVTLAALLAHGGTAYIASTIRNPETRALFLSKLADEASLQYEPCAGPREKIFFYDRSCPVAIDKITACSR